MIKTNYDQGIIIHHQFSGPSSFLLIRIGIMSPLQELLKIKKSIQQALDKAFGALYIFLNSLILRHHRISKNENFIQNGSFYKKFCFKSRLNIYYSLTLCDIILKE